MEEWLSLYERLHMHRAVCDIDSLRNQADGEPQCVAGPEGRAGGDFVFEVVLHGESTSGVQIFP